MSLKYKSEIIILYSCGCRRTYFETKRSAENDEQNKLNRNNILLRLQTLHDKTTHLIKKTSINDLTLRIFQHTSSGVTVGSEADNFRDDYTKNISDKKHGLARFLVRHVLPSS